ncbi:RSM24 [Candida oxycetoniae]|uniref:RSM24 n=1 Tax=Candida oxycetoniae TaxID=497107 RepID=A0AAI9SW21_9ASCO|nr:RSM24 [Candida oxycetoniae]KAI3403904.2 RSM24 [Candida oxycetoniae]
MTRVKVKTYQGLSLFLRTYSTPVTSRAASSTTKAKKPDLFLNPHAWKGLPADQIFQLHQMRKAYMGDAYNPTNEERTAILSTISSLSSNKPALDYSFEIENFKERVMNNTPMKERGKPQKLSNQFVINTGAAPHRERRIENLTRILAYETPLLAKYRQPYQPKSRKEAPIKLTFHSDFTEETSNKNNRVVKLSVELKDLGLNQEQEHKFKILAGGRFRYDTNSFHLKCERYPEAAQNANWLTTTFNRLLSEAKDLSKETFSDIPLDKRHMKIWSSKMDKPVFPESWKRVEDAPEKRHNIVNRLVELKAKVVDIKELQNLAP